MLRRGVAGGSIPFDLETELDPESLMNFIYLTVRFLYYNVQVSTCPTRIQVGLTISGKLLARTVYGRTIFRHLGSFRFDRSRRALTND